MLCCVLMYQGVSCCVLLNTSSPFLFFLFIEFIGKSVHEITNNFILLLMQSDVSVSVFIINLINIDVGGMPTVRLSSAGDKSTLRICTYAPILILFLLPLL